MMAIKSFWELHNHTLYLPGFEVYGTAFMCVCACEGERAQLYIVAYWNLDFYLEWF
jgi:hypothetical protein